MITIEEEFEALYQYYGVENDNQLAKALGFRSNSNVANWRKNKHIPAKYLTNLPNKMHKNEYLNVYRIPLVNQKVSAGYGEITVYKIEPIDELPLHKSLFRTTPCKDILAIQVKGRSMEPTIEDGSFVLFQENPEFNGDDLYIIVKDSELYVKRLFLDMEGNLNVVSDNKEFPSFIINKDSQEFNFIIGKVKQIIPLFRG